MKHKKTALLEAVFLLGRNLGFAKIPPTGGVLAGVFLEHQRRVGAAEAERVRECKVDRSAVYPFGWHRDIADGRVGVFDICRGCDEALFHHDHCIDGFLHARSAQ